MAALNYRFIPQAMEQGVEPPVKACARDAARPCKPSVRRRGVERRSPANRLHRRFGGSVHVAVAGVPRRSGRPGAAIHCPAIVATDVRGGERGANVPRSPGTAQVDSQRGLWRACVRLSSRGRGREEEFELLLKADSVLPWIKEYSPIELVSKDDPPIYLGYQNQKRRRLSGEGWTQRTRRCTASNWSKS